MTWKKQSPTVLLNKADLADERQNEAWKAYFQMQRLFCGKDRLQKGFRHEDNSERDPGGV